MHCEIHASFSLDLSTCRAHGRTTIIRDGRAASGTTSTTLVTVHSSFTLPNTGQARFNWVSKSFITTISDTVLFVRCCKQHQPPRAQKDHIALTLPFIAIVLYLQWPRPNSTEGGSRLRDNNSTTGNRVQSSCSRPYAGDRQMHPVSLFDVHGHTPESPVGAKRSFLFTLSAR